ncbi:MAG: DMT family transporter [Helicobacter sp.]|nr:DMT family transporter [Helicobacter sp.]
MQAKFVIQLCIAMFFWGGAWSATKLIVDYTSIDVLAFWRFVFAAACFLPMVLFLRVNLAVSRRTFLFLFLASCANVGYALLSFRGIVVGLAGAGGVLVTTLIPIATFLLAFLVYRHKPSRLESLGLTLGLVSGFLLTQLHTPELLFANGNLYFVASAFVWAILTLLLQNIHHDIHPVAINFYICSLSVILFVPLIENPAQLLDIFGFDWLFWAGLLFISCCSIAIGTTLYYHAIKQLGGSKASAFNLLVPLFAMMLSWALLGETPTLNTILGGSLAIVAILCLSRR